MPETTQKHIQIEIINGKIGKCDQFGKERRRSIKKEKEGEQTNNTKDFINPQAVILVCPAHSIYTLTVGG